MKKTIDKIVRQTIKEYYDREDVGRPKKYKKPCFDEWGDDDDDDDDEPGEDPPMSMEARRRIHAIIKESVKSILKEMAPYSNKERQRANNDNKKIQQSQQDARSRYEKQQQGISTKGPNFMQKMQRKSLKRKTSKGYDKNKPYE